MRLRKSPRQLTVATVVALVLLVEVFGFSNAFAQYSSSQYKFNESAVMSGGDVDQSSTSYRSRNGVGEIGIGNQTGTLFQANSGFVTSDEEYLDVNVSGGEWDLGYMTPVLVASRPILK
jgi:hypothetical protein